jgi:adenosine deaminase
MSNLFDWHIHLTGSIPVEYWSRILSRNNQLNRRTIDDLKGQLYMDNSSAWSELKVCTDTEEGFRDTVIFVIENMISRGVKGANFIFNPHSLIKRGLDISKTFEILNSFLQGLLDEKKFYPLFRMGVNRRDGLEELERIAKVFKMEKSKYV